MSTQAVTVPGTKPAPVALVVEVEPEGLYAGHTVRLSGHLIGYRPYDGSDSHEVAGEVLASFAALLRERFGWPERRED